MTADMIELGNPRIEEYGRVGELVYIVDPYIYPALFGSSEIAKAAMPTLMHIKNSPFAPELVNVARIDGLLVGVLVLYTKPFANLPDFTCFYRGGLPLPMSSRDVCDNYLRPMCANVRNDEAYIPCIATEPAYRGMGIASALIGKARQLAGKLPLTLDVLRDNDNAIRLYEKHGFSYYGEADGYDFSGHPPKVITMKTT